MAIVTVTSACNENLLPSFTFENDHTHLRDASFSSYLSGEETIFLKLGESTRSSSTDLASPLCPARRISDGEISVFEAEKYFNGEVENEEKRSKKQGNDSSTLEKNPRTVFKSGTPSDCSVTSWNSKSALLPNFSKDAQAGDLKQGKGKKFFGSFGCKCVCSGKKSVEIDENQTENRNKSFTGNGRKSTGKNSPEIDSWRSRGSGLNREECFSFPILNPTVEIQNRKLTVGSRVVAAELETPRISSDVYDMGSNLKKRLMMLTFNDGGEIECFPASSEAPAVGADGNVGENEDSGSDSSSDLFEIGSLSGNPDPLYRHRNSDDISVVTATCYEPDEASIEWRVTGASNFSLEAPEHDNLDPVMKMVAPTFSTKSTTTMTTTTTTTTSTKTTTVKRVRQGGLLCCGSDKEVKVAAANACRTPVKVSESYPRCRLRSNALMPVKNYPAMYRGADFESSHVQGAFAKRSLSVSRTHSAQVSHSLYML